VQSGVLVCFSAVPLKLSLHRTLGTSVESHRSDEHFLELLSKGEIYQEVG